MTAVAWTMIALFVFSACCSIATVGKPREPLTAGSAVAILIVNMALCVGVYWLWRS